jgi:CDP-diacylglycerol--glycerol-3-phosphate 3-phosphatidyltransferase
MTELQTWLTSPTFIWAPFAAMFAMFLTAFIVFGVQVARSGLPQYKRGEGMASSIMGPYFVSFAFWLFAPVAKLAVRFEVHPDSLTWTSLVLQLLSAVVVGLGGFGVGGWLLLVGAVCDSLDGTVARARNLSSNAGEVLDAIVDRWADMAVFFGLAWYFHDYFPGFFLAVWAAAASMMVSYTRAKGESFQVDAKMGLMQRHERITYTVSGLLLSGLVELKFPSGAPARHYLMQAVLAGIAVLATQTSIRRTAFMRTELRKR